MKQTNGVLSAGSRGADPARERSKLLKQVRIGTGAAIVDIDLTGMASGMYIAELALDDVRAGQVKVTVQ